MSNLETLIAYNIDRDIAVASLDVETFKQFCKRWGYQVPSSDFVIEITMRKMMYHITTFPKEERKAAKEWLEAHGCTTDLG